MLSAKPPRTSGLSTARPNALSLARSAFSGVSFGVVCPVFSGNPGSRSGPPRFRSGRCRGCRSSRRRKRRIIVRMLGNFFHILHVPDHVFPVQNENGSALNAQVLDQRPVVVTEGSVAVIREHLYLVDSERAAPPLLRKRQVHAHRQNVHAGKLGRFL